MPDRDQIYMRRCIELSLQGEGAVAPNPMVGAVLVYGDRIIGEGYHAEYGAAHAEVNCINSVKEEDKKFIGSATIYVSLEPCAHFGKTPPCSDLIIHHKIPKVVIGCRDPFPQVNGKGLEKLRKAGIEVICGVLEKECKQLNKRFFTFVQKQRPYIILKWAQTANGKIGGDTNERMLISNEYSNRLVHQWRSKEAAILVGTNTAVMDNPSLTTRLWKGKNPVRLLLDMGLRVPVGSHLFNPDAATIVFNALKNETKDHIRFIKVDPEKPVIGQVLTAAYELQLQSIIVEGGAVLLQSFLRAGIWDEARIITNETLTITGGLSAPLPGQAVLLHEQEMGTDKIRYYANHLS